MSSATVASARSKSGRHHRHSVVITYSNQKYVPGKSHTGLMNNANNTTSVLRQHGIHAVPVPVDNANGLRAYLNANGDQVTHVVIQAIWMAPGDISAICQAFPLIEFSVVCHSGYAFLSTEGKPAIDKLYATMNLAAQLPNLVVACNSGGMCDDLSLERAQPVTYLPNLYPTDFILENQPVWRGGTLLGGIFCSPREGKNMPEQFAGFGILCRKLKTQGILMYNTGRSDGGAQNQQALKIINAANAVVAGNPFVTTKGYPWRSMPEHVQLASSCNVNFQVSHYETANLVTMDAIAAGVPTVVGPSISWTPSYWQARPDSAKDIARVAYTLLTDPSAADDGVQALTAYNAQAVIAWENWIQQGITGVGANVWPSRRLGLHAQGSRRQGLD
jgi:hypothetical protein